MILVLLARTTACCDLVVVLFGTCVTLLLLFSFACGFAGLLVCRLFVLYLVYLGVLGLVVCG